MPLPPIDTSDPEALLTRVLELSVPLHSAIAPFDEPGATYELAGAPGVAFFERDALDTISHVSGSPSPALAQVLEDLRSRYLRAIGAPDDMDNSHLPPLLLLCCYLADPATRARISLDQIIARPAQIRAIDEEEGRHDPPLEPRDAALRAWVPLTAQHAPDAGVHPAILELHFAAQRYERIPSTLTP